MKTILKKSTALLFALAFCGNSFADTNVSLVAGVLTVSGASSEAFLFTDDGTYMYIHNSVAGFTLTGTDVSLHDANTAKVLLSSITDSIGIDGVSGTDTLNIDLSTTLPGVNIGTANFRYIYQSNTLSTGSGNIHLVGRLVQVNGAIETTSGKIFLTAVVSASGLIGVVVNATGSLSSNTGNITLNGTVQAGNPNPGVRINGGSISSVDGDVLLNAQGTILSTTTPLSIDGGTLTTTGNGDLTLTSYNRYSSNQPALSIINNAILSVVDGNLLVFGEYDTSSPGSTENYRHGVYAYNGVTVSSTGVGTITINGIAGKGGAGGGPENGIYLVHNVLITSIQGDINLTGTGCWFDQGAAISMEDGCQISSTGVGANAANITLLGRSVSPVYTVGIAIQAMDNMNPRINLTSIDGDIHVLGVSLDPSKIAFFEFTNLYAATTGEGSIYLNTDQVYVSQGTHSANDLEFVADILSYNFSYHADGNITVRTLTDDLDMRLGYSLLAGTLSMEQDLLDSLVIDEIGGEYTFGSASTGDVLINYTNNGGRPVNFQGSSISVVSLVADGDIVRYSPIAGGVIKEATGHVSTKAAEVVINGRLAPGDVGTAGLFKVEGNVTFSTGDTLAIDLLTGDNDSLQLLGASSVLTLTGSVLDLNEVSFTPTLDEEIVIIDVAGTEAVVGTFAGIPEGGGISVGGNLYRVSYVGGTGNDVTVTFAAPTCDMPVDPMVTGITDTSAILSWTGGVVGADRYQMRWRAVGTEMWYARNTFGEVGFRHVKAFEPDTEYEWIIRTRCGVGNGDSSLWVAGPNFTTLPGCGPVQDVTISNITQTQVDASWPNHDGATEYLLRFKPTSASVWRSRRVDGSTTSTTLRNLLPATEYEYRLRVYCESGLSRRGELFNFTTASGPGSRLAAIEDEAMAEFVLYPNPTQGDLTIEFGSEVENATVDVMNALGQTVFSKAVTNADRVHLTMDLQSGVYLVSVTIGTERKMTKLVVE